MTTRRFKLEDRIFHHLWGLGTIKEIGDHDYAVEFDEKRAEFHDCCGVAEYLRGFYIDFEENMRTEDEYFSMIHKGKRYVHVVYGECIVTGVTTEGLSVIRIETGKLIHEITDGIIPVEQYISIGDVVQDYTEKRTGVVTEIKQDGFRRYGVKFNDENGIDFCCIGTLDKKSVRISKKEKPILSVGEKITARRDKIIVVEKIHEKLWRRYYSVKINGIEDIIKEHGAMFYKKTMQTRKIDSFSLESDIL